MIYMLLHSQLCVICGVGFVVCGVLRVVAWCACVLACMHVCVVDGE